MDIKMASSPAVEIGGYERSASSSFRLARFALFVDLVDSIPITDRPLRILDVGDDYFHPTGDGQWTWDWSSWVVDDPTTIQGFPGLVDRRIRMRRSRGHAVPQSFLPRSLPGCDESPADRRMAGAR